MTIKGVPYDRRSPSRSLAKQSLNKASHDPGRRSTPEFHVPIRRRNRDAPSNIYIPQAAIACQQESDLLSASFQVLLYDLT
ncbi:MAG TPA: hypothetical protein VGM15_08755, partial [Burkholderiaceae bacterium]